MDEQERGREIRREAVPPYVVDLCQQLRRRLTPAERLLWARLRHRRQRGYKFRRQHPLGRYIADFYCAEAALVIEIDGGVHGLPEQRKYDEGREAELTSRNLKVVRFTNDEIEADVEGVLATIQSHLGPPPASRH